MLLKMDILFGQFCCWAFAYTVSSNFVNFALAVFDLDLRLGYLCNLKSVALNDIIFFSTQTCKFKTEAIYF